MKIILKLATLYRSRQLMTMTLMLVSNAMAKCMKMKKSWPELDAFTIHVCLVSTVTGLWIFQDTLMEEMEEFTAKIVTVKNMVTEADLNQEAKMSSFLLKVGM